MDFFKIFGFQDYNKEQVVGINREMITTTTFNHFKDTEKFDSYILGSSRSQAFKCVNWLPFLDKGSKPFHFDASGEGVWGISKKLEYLDETGSKIKNVLIVIDRKGLIGTGVRKGHLFISMPCISKLSTIEYYYVFIKVSLNPKFLVAYLDYSIFEVAREYLKSYIHTNKYKDVANYVNCDIWDGYDQEIREDSLGYYQNLKEKKIFYDRPVSTISRCDITDKEISQLKSIKRIFDKHKTQFKIVISPVYDQVPLEKNQLELLNNLFGSKYIYNFSGKNKMTEPISNFYEESHYRPHVANQIMKKIYKMEK
ncbi:hypothetical protein [Flavobacterium ovatum]|uniref:hypothetical protein n=1 Tax=Flavobacterium ovatum TaxID=1928857 RepID=UPI00344E0ADA